MMHSEIAPSEIYNTSSILTYVREIQFSSVIFDLNIDSEI